MVSICLRDDNRAMKAMTYGEWLKMQRRRRRMTQVALERAANLSEKYVSRMENKGTLPEDDVRERVHTVFGTSDGELAELGILDRLVGPDGSVVYVKPERSIPAPDSDLDTLRAYIKSGEIDEKAAGEILEWWGKRQRGMEEG